MNISNKQELQQIAFNHLSNICYEDFMNFYKKSTSKSYYCLVIDTALDTFTFKLQHNINREAAKISALGKVHKYEYVTGEEKLHSHQSRMIE